MPDVLASLVALLAPEPIADGRFRAPSEDLGWGTVFGGQVLGQALAAAARTVPADRPAHSLHAYFLRPGDARSSIVYTVDPIRDGGSFSTRLVTGAQGEHAIVSLSASFQRTEPGLSHAAAMPDVPGPDGLLSELEIARRAIDRIPEALRPIALADRPIEIRPVQPYDILSPRAAPPRRQLWFRATGALPDDPALHRCLLAYASDFNFLVTALQPHAVSWLTPGMQVASIDHAVWFHRPFRMDDWLLYDIDSPSASGARGLVHGRVHARDGALVASVTQEGLMRDRRGGSERAGG